jgi:hypothetical protein
VRTGIAVSIVAKARLPGAPAMETSGVRKSNHDRFRSGATCRAIPPFMRRSLPPLKGIAPMLSALLPAFLAIAPGISIVIQQALNANLRSALYSAAWSGFVSYAVGLACMGLLALALRDPILQLGDARPMVGVERRSVRRHFHCPQHRPCAADWHGSVPRAARHRADARLNHLRSFRLARPDPTSD